MSSALGCAESQSQPDPSAQPAPQRRFKIVDVVSGATIAEYASTNAAVGLLAAVDSIFDVRIFVWIPEMTAWRELTPGEQRILWDFRGR
ncbi:MAG: hypothetical protein QOE11_62 [Solirubrobacteraceae bacterium]|nr:hypothetical protein [Solirubrobacteraceae bacterium]